MTGVTKPTRELCIMACVFCRDPQFLDYLNQLVGSEITDDSPFTEFGAKSFILTMCRITSRNALDTDPAAAARFHEMVRVPFMEWKESSA